MRFNVVFLTRIEMEIEAQDYEDAENTAEAMIDNGKVTGEIDWCIDEIDEIEEI